MGGAGPGFDRGQGFGRAMVGLVTLLLALCSGLLVFTAFSVFTTQQSEAYSLARIVADVDLALELCGPEAAGGRAGLREALSGVGSTWIVGFFCFRCATGIVSEVSLTEPKPWSILAARTVHQRERRTMPRTLGAGSGQSSL